MNRLFIKIFLWFWLAMALVWSAFSLPTQLTQNEDVVDRFRALTGQRLILAGRVAVNLGRRSPEAIEQFMADLEEEGAPYPFVFDEELTRSPGEPHRRQHWPPQSRRSTTASSTADSVVPARTQDVRSSTGSTTPMPSCRGSRTVWTCRHPACFLSSFGGYRFC